MVLVLTGFRVAVFKAVPPQIKIAISVGIGLFIALIGLVDAGFVRRTASGPVPVGLGVNGNLVGWPTVVFVFGTLLIIALMVRKVKGAILIGISASNSLGNWHPADVQHQAKLHPRKPSNNRRWRLAAWVFLRFLRKLLLYQSLISPDSLISLVHSASITFH